MQRQRQDATVARHFHDGRPTSRRGLTAWDGIPGADAPPLKAGHDHAVDGPGLNASFHGKDIALLYGLNRGIHLHLGQRRSGLLPKFPDFFRWHGFLLPCSCETLAHCTRKIMARDMIELKREELLACSQSLFDQPQPTEDPRSHHDEEWI